MLPHRLIPIYLLCRKLQLEYLDLYLIHWPINLRKEASHPNPKEEDFLPLDIKSMWRGLEQCVELGLTKSIGVSNFSCKKIEELLRYANIPPVVNQVELNPLWQQKKAERLLQQGEHSCQCIFSSRSIWYLLWEQCRYRKYCHSGDCRKAWKVSGSGFVEVGIGTRS